MEIDLHKIGQDIYLFRDNPGELDEVNLKLAGWYAFYSSQLIPLELAEAKFWEQHKDIGAEKPKSDSFVRALWKITKDGQRMIELERTLKTIEKLMSAIRSSLARQDRELRAIK